MMKMDVFILKNEIKKLEKIIGYIFILGVVIV